MTMPLCTVLREFEAHDSQSVILIGVYKAIAVQQGPPKLQAIAERNSAAIYLSDGHRILLEPSWSPASKRDPDERERFDGIEVEVEGVAHAISPKPPELIAYLIGPCISPVVSIHPVVKEAA